MGLKIVLLTPRRRFIANRAGLGYQVPLGLVLIGGPLADAGHRVRLLDNDVQGWDDNRLARELGVDPPDCILIGHTGSTAAHPVAMETARALKRRLPDTVIVTGGVYPSYNARSVLLFRTRFVTPGDLDRVPGYPAPKARYVRARASSYSGR